MYEGVESIDYLFVTCEMVLRVWYQVFRWLGWDWMLPWNIEGLFQVFVSLGSQSRDRLGVISVWHAVESSI